MSVNWVMLDPKQVFVRLPGETLIHTSPARTGLSMSTPRAYPGNSPLSIKSSAGTIYLTNQRILYLPATPTPQFQSFACPLTNLHDTHLTTPLFGPNGWQAVVQPVSGGGLPSTQTHIEMQLTFKDGGAYDFHTSFERIKERLLQAMESAHEGPGVGGQSSNSVADVNMGAVHLDDLPTYQDSGRDQLATQPEPSYPSRRPLIQQEESAPPFEETAEGMTSAAGSSAPPTDAPPGYEETQRQRVEQELEEVSRRL